MNNKQGRSPNPLRATLQRRKTEVYLGILRQYAQAHSSYDFLVPAIALIRARDIKGLFELVDSLSKTGLYMEATQHLVASQFVHLVKKYPWPKDLIDLNPQAAAVEQFRKAERRCELINRKFAFLHTNPARDVYDREGGRARAWIRSVIGSRPNYRACFSQADFGPGAAIGVHGDATSYSRKFSAERWSVTPGAVHHGFAAVMANHHLLEQFFERRGEYYCYDLQHAFTAYVARMSVTSNNKISFVPKTAKIMRTIAVEPLLNSLVQKGIDKVLRGKLLRVGIDLSDQGLNQELARQGSERDDEESFVTIDLSAASDSVSMGIVDYLVPEDWRALLGRVRSPSYEIDGVVDRYHKYCSMGNGFCFPLETLIFASACFASGCGVPRQDFAVYGDDIIVRKKHATRLLALLAHWGFKVNHGKTFLSGPFRESCGADWFGGKDVRPFTLDYELDRVENVFKFLNLSRRSPMVEEIMAPLRERVLSAIPLQYRFFRPFKGAADTGIDSTGDEHLYSPHCQLVDSRNVVWEWKELSFETVLDKEVYERSDISLALMSEALRGSTSVSYGALVGSPKVVFRRKTKAKVVRKSYSSTSNWLPTQSIRS